MNCAYAQGASLSAPAESDEAAAREIVGPCHIVPPRLDCPECTLIPKIASALSAARARERERCAVIAETHPWASFAIASAIRAPEGRAG